MRFDGASRTLYATDASNYWQPPVGVVLPRTIGDVAAAIEIAREHGVALLNRGGGTSLAGQGCNAALVIDFSRHLNRILHLDVEKRLVRVEPGCVLDDLQNHLRPAGLIFGPDPATSAQCTLGGMIGNNACGVHSQMAGRTVENVEELEVLTYDGLRLTVGHDGERLDRILKKADGQAALYGRLLGLRDRYQQLIRERFPDIPRRVSGFNLDELLPERGFNVAGSLVGSEGTCVTILSAVLRLVEGPPARALSIVGFPDICSAADAVPEFVEREPIACEGLDRHFVAFGRSEFEKAGKGQALPGGEAWIVAEFSGATPEEAEAAARKTAERFEERGLPAAVLPGRTEQDLLWKSRKAALGAEYGHSGERAVLPGWEDAAVAPDRLGGYLREFTRLVEESGYRTFIYGHFGQGCVHSRLNFDLSSRPGREAFESFVRRCADLVSRLGGSLSGEHGDGQARGELLSTMYGKELVGAFREFKSIWDPASKMNPGKLVDAMPLTAHLRDHRESAVDAIDTRFRYPRDGGRFRAAVDRCIGIGACRRLEEGVMCPSYRVTREEKHTTRGRSRLLQDMLRGSVLTGGWRSPEVKGALDLCLACKGCKSDCPAGVDIATYKAEFLSHFYKGRLRPRQAYLFGLVDRWLSLGSKFPQLVNFLSQAPALSSLAKMAGGIARDRQIPRIARQPFVKWFRSEGGSASPGDRILLFPDTFTNYLAPEIGAAAVRVLGRAGFRVTIPRKRLCCGRPLYDAGMLSLASLYLERLLEGLREEIERGTPLIVLEPSCAAVFRDELGEMMPENRLAGRLARQTFLLSEFLERHWPKAAWPRTDDEVIFHPHCHQRAVLDVSAEQALLSRLSGRISMPEPSCCGMAGAFGFEAGKRYDVSVACGERRLFPEVRNASPETLIVADGFSCREQIFQGTGRKALHLAEVLDRTLARSGDRDRDPFRSIQGPESPTELLT